jgi:hypothetical protein
VSLLGRFFAWRARRRHAKHLARMRKLRVVGCKPEPKCIVRNLREPNR